MSRSKKKTSILGIAGDSEKQDKRINNRMFRRREKVAIEQDKEPPYDMNEVRNVWSMAKDGKYYVQNPKDKWMRK